MKIWKSRYLYMAIVLILCSLVVFLGKTRMTENPFETLTLSEVVYATSDSQGNTWIVDQSGKRIVRRTSEGVIDRILHATSNDEGFYEARRIAVGEDNNLYVYTYEKNGYRIRQERIIEFDTDGKYIRTVMKEEYQDPLLVGNLEKMIPYESSMAYVMREDSHFAVFDSSGQKIEAILPTQSMDDIVSLAVNPSSTTFYYSTKNGKIYQGSTIGEKTDTVIYSDLGSNGLSTPREVAIGTDGNLYFADIGERTLDVIDLDQDVTRELIDLSDGILQDQPIYYYVDAANLVIGTSDWLVTLVDENGQESQITEGTLSDEIRLSIILSWLALVVGALIGLYLIGKLFLWVMEKESGVFKTTTGMIIIIAMAAGVLLLLILPDFKEQILDGQMARAQDLSDITVNQLPAKALSEIDSPRDYNSSDYIEVRDAVKNIFLEDSEGTKEFYCFIYRIIDGAVTCVYSTPEYTGAFYPYDWPVEGSDEEEILSTGVGKTYSDSSSSEGAYMFVYDPVFDENGNPIAIIEVGRDLNAMNQETQLMIQKILINVIVMTVILVLIGLEIVIFWRGREVYLRAKHQNRTQNLKLPWELLRIIVFSIFFITNLSTSFLPRYAMEIAGSGGKIPQEVLAAIPLSAEVLAGAIASLTGTFFLRRWSEKKVGIIFGGLFFGGLLLRCLVPNIWLLTLGNAVMGWGWGVLLLQISSIIAEKEEKDREIAFAGNSAAALNGVCCGVVFGGFLQNWLSEWAILVTGTILSIGLIIHSIHYMSSGVKRQLSDLPKEKNPIRVLSFLRQPRIVLFFIFLVIPIIAAGYYMTYLLPILGQQFDMQETYIGYIYLIYGLCVIALGPALAPFLSNKLSKRHAFLIGALLYIAAFVSVAWYNDVKGLVLSLLYIGIADSFALPFQVSYYTEMDSVRDYGYDKAMGIYSLFENFSQMMGSFLFSYIVLVGLRKGLIGLSLGLALCVLIFWTTSMRLKKKTSIGG